MFGWHRAAEAIPCYATPPLPAAGVEGMAQVFLCPDNDQLLEWCLTTMGSWHRLEQSSGGFILCKELPQWHIYAKQPLYHGEVKVALHAHTLPLLRFIKCISSTVQGLGLRSLTLKKLLNYQGNVTWELTNFQLWGCHLGVEVTTVMWRKRRYFDFW